MKKTFFSILVVAVIASCTSPNKETSPSSEPRPGIASVDSSKLIIPGKSIGKLYLNQDMDSVFRIMGRADAGDAAMGKAWGIWFSTMLGSQVKDQTAVYSSYKDTSMVAKSAKEILVTAEAYRTTNGLGSGIPLDSLKKELPSLKQVAKYVNDSEQDTLEIYDDISSGIAFEIKRRDQGQISTAVYVHFPNVSVNNTYLTIYPDWRRL
jgi:hypothetical protein